MTASNSLGKLLGILDFFTGDAPVWSATEIVAALGTSRATGYRYIRALTSAGLLSAVGNGHYVLGSRIIELDLQIRKGDPLLKASEGVLERLRDETGHSALLCTLFQNSVLCVRVCRSSTSATALINRGQRRSLFRGAMSKVILAHLSLYQLRNVYARRQAEINQAKLGRHWDDFRDALSRIRSAGFAKSAGESTPGLVGISAPIFNAEQVVIGSVGVAWSATRNRIRDHERIAGLVKRAGEQITRRLSRPETGKVLGPRAVR